MAIRVILNGANGKMGKVTSAYLKQNNDFNLVRELGRQDSLAQALKETPTDVVIDFTLPDVVFENAKIMIEANVHPVIGTSGLKPPQIEELKKLCAQKQLGGVIAPNFSISAVLLMKFAAEAAKYFPHAEIIEAHHPKKLDAPSGTAIKTAQLIAQAKKPEIPAPNGAARGDHSQAVVIHSMRLAGIFAEETVTFGGEGETLSIQQRSIDRQCMMPGVGLACKKVLLLNELMYGLELLLL